MTPITHDRHGLKLRLHRTRDGLAAGAKDGLFQRVCDWVSAAMGRPLNIAVWAILVTGWVCIFAFGGPRLASGSWMPAWFTSLGFNLPLNLTTTVAELFIGFLVGAASNRSERNLEATLGRIEQVETGIGGVLGAVKTLLENVAGLVSRTHDMQGQQMTILGGQDKALGALTAISADLAAIRQALTPQPPAAPGSAGTAGPKTPRGGKQM